MACSTIRYGLGVTKEIGMDMMNMKIKKACVMTDLGLSNLPPVKTTLDSLSKYGIAFELYDRVRVEPTDYRFQFFYVTRSHETLILSCMIRTFTVWKMPLNSRDPLNLTHSSLSEEDLLWIPLKRPIYILVIRKHLC